MAKKIINPKNAKEPKNYILINSHEHKVKKIPREIL